MVRPTERGAKCPGAWRSVEAPGVYTIMLSHAIFFILISCTICNIIYYYEHWLLVALGYWKVVEGPVKVEGCIFINNLKGLTSLFSSPVLDVSITAAVLCYRAFQVKEMFHQFDFLSIDCYLRIVRIVSYFHDFGLICAYLDYILLVSPLTLLVSSSWSFACSLMRTTSSAKSSLSIVFPCRK